MKNYHTRYTKESFEQIVKSVVDEIGYFPSEREYRKYRKGKRLPMPKVAESLFGMTWPEYGKKHHLYIPDYDRTLNMECPQCGKPFSRHLSWIQKNTRNFCSQSCSATYNNTHKTYGTRRSKLEKWLEEQLINLYPDLEIYFNRKDAINSELDIYIPELKLAFEMNGIYHYEPIHGPEKFAQVQNNDDRKFQACLETGIELCLIDTSQQKCFTEKSSKKYLDIIINIIKMKKGNG